MSRGHWTWPLSRAIPFKCYSLWTGFTRSLCLFLMPFIKMWCTMRSFSENLNLWITLNVVCFTIPPPQIYILPKAWFTIMGVTPPYPNVANYNIFSNPWQSIRGQSIRFPFYLSKTLYHVGCRHKFPQHRPTQQVHFPVQVSEHQVSPKSTQGGLSLWSRVWTTSFPHHRIFIDHCSSIDTRASLTMMRT